jgi:hypothetical protein
MEVKMDLKKIADYYILEIRPIAKAELDWFRKQPDLTTALEKAAFAKSNDNGKRYNHQRRLQLATLELANQAMLTHFKSIEHSTSFDNLFALFESILGPIRGIGELYIYDTALRVGAKLNILPTKVYLHAGTRTGAKALGLDSKAKSLEISLLPIELQTLEPYELEDVLCTFKSNFEKPELKLSPGCMIKRTRSC